MESSPATSVHERNADQGHDDHHGPDADGGVLGVGLTQPCGDEQVGGVVEHGVDAGQLLRQLHDNGDGEWHPEGGGAEQLPQCDL